MQLFPLQLFNLRSLGTTYQTLSLSFGVRDTYDASFLYQYNNNNIAIKPNPHNSLYTQTTDNNIIYLNLTDNCVYYIGYFEDLSIIVIHIILYSNIPSYINDKFHWYLPKLFLSNFGSKIFVVSVYH